MDNQIVTENGVKSNVTSDTSAVALQGNIYFAYQI